MDAKLLEILCCPSTKTPVRMVSRIEIDALNQLISDGGVLTTAHKPVNTPLTEALITRDGKIIYRVEDGIPVMLIDEGINTLQLRDFPT
ncbi:MAG: Trm112 family protein [Dokdonella sp.]